MMVDHQREGSVDSSRGISIAGSSSINAAVAAVVGSAPAHVGGDVPMHRVLSAPLLSPPAHTDGGRSREGRRSAGLEESAQRLPPLRQVCR